MDWIHDLMGELVSEVLVQPSWRSSLSCSLYRFISSGRS